MKFQDKTNLFNKYYPPPVGTSPEIRGGRSNPIGQILLSDYFRTRHRFFIARSPPETRGDRGGTSEK